MDMQDPSLVPGGETKDQTLNEAAASVAEAVTVTPDPEAAVEVEDIMAQGEADAELEAERQPDTDESLMAQALALLAKDASEISTDDIRRLRQHYSMLHKPAPAAEGEQAAEPMPENNEFTLIIERLKSKKAAWVAEQEAIKAANLERKNAIIDEINALAEDTDNVNRTFARYRELQDEFNAIGDVDPMQETSVWKRFQEAREHYSDNLKINKELRDYDFKKNLEDKEALLAEATALLADEDVIAAYRRLQDLHNKWRQIGPVAKELREDIWGRFREASTEINKRYQAFFEARKAREAENEAAKTELCQKIEAIDLTTLKTFAAWEETTRSIVALQEDWRKLGFASKKANRSLFARFRRACDAFFAAKAEFYRSTREELSTNLAHKQQLVERAEALKDSTDWRAAADEFIAMQKEWKSIGAIPKKYSDALWARFTEACDYFFDQKKKPAAAHALSRPTTSKSSVKSSVSFQPLSKKHRTRPQLSNSSKHCSSAGTKPATCLSAKKTNYIRPTARLLMLCATNSTWPKNAQTASASLQTLTRSKATTTSCTTNANAWYAHSKTAATTCALTRTTSASFRQNRKTAARCSTI